MTVDLLASSSGGVIDLPKPVEPDYDWYSCDLKTGRVQERLPLVGSPSKLLGAVTTLTLSCDLAALGAGIDFWGSTIPRRTMVVLERKFPDQNTADILWAGAVINRPERGSEPIASLGCVSLEGLLDRRFAGTHTYTGQPSHTDAQIITDLIGEANVDGWNIQLDLDGLTTVRQVRYRAPERRKILACLQELSDMENGPEWTIRATRSGDIVTKTLVARPRLGTASTIPNAQFRWPGAVKSYGQTEEHSDGLGANYVTAVANGEGASQPSFTRSDAARIAVEGRWEAVVQRPAARTIAALDSAAATELALMLEGQNLYTLTADAVLAPKIGIDWVLGDDIRLLVTAGARDPDGQPSYGHPDGLDVIARGIGWTLDPQTQTLTPLLWQPSEGPLD